jgi:flavin-dependent thymidylate synthase
MRIDMSGKEIQRYGDLAMFESEDIDFEAQVRPRVHLLSATPDPLGAVAAFAMMYEGRVIRDLSEITDAERISYFDDCFNTALRTPLEAIDLHFMVEGLTRASWDQMVRQRTAVFAGESLRFAVKPDLNDCVRKGPGIQTPTQRYVWNKAVQAISEAYHELIADGVPAEDARGLLPLNVLVRGEWKTNLRNLEAEVGKRLCTQAQFEWRLIHTDLRKAIREYNGGSRLMGHQVKQFVSSQWQFEHIAESEMFKPICFQKGACMFKAGMDRGCKIRDRVDAGQFDKIMPQEWLLDPTAGITTAENPRPNDSREAI